MAEEIIFKVKTDTGNSVKEVSNIDKELKKASSSTDALNKSNKRTAQSIDQTAKALDKSKQSLSGVDNELKKVEKSSLTFEQKLANINKEVDSGELSFRDMNKKLQEFQSIALAAGRTSPVGKQALQSAANLQDKLTDLRNETTRLANDHKNLQGVMQVGAGVVAGYGAVKGAMALVGVENEELQKSLQKLMAAQTVLNSINQIKIALEKESQAMMVLSAAKTKILAVVQTAWTAATTGTTVAMKILNASMMAMPIIAIIAGIIALVAMIYNMVKANETAEAMNNAVTDSLEKYSAALERNSKAAIRNADNAIKTAEARGASAEELHKLELKRMDVEEENRKKLTAATKRELDVKLEVLKIALKEGNDEIAESVTGEIETIKSKYIDLRDMDGQYFIDKSNKETAFAREQAAKQKAEDDKAIAERKATEDKLSEARKAAREKADAEAQQAEAERLTRAKLLTDLMIANVQDEQLRARMVMLENHKRERDDLVAKYGEDLELLKQLKQNQNNEIIAADLDLASKQKAIEDAKTVAKKAQIQADLEARYNDSKAQLELDLLLMAENDLVKAELQNELNALELERVLANDDLTESERLLIKEQYKQKEIDLEEVAAEKKKQLNEDVKEASIQTAEMGLAALQQISSILFEDQLNKAEKGSEAELKIKKKQFAINKKLQIAQAIMQGVQAVQAAFSSGSAIPIVGAVTGPAFAALAGVASVLNVRKIANTKFDSGGAGGSITPPSSPPPSIPTASSITPEETGSGASSTLTGGLSGSQGVKSQSIKVNIVDSEMKAGLDNAAKVDAISTIE